jgi:hypothetical protein
VLDRAGTTFEQVPLVHADDEGTALALDEVGDAKILFLERPLRVHQQNDDLGETHGMKRVRHGELLQFLLDARATAQSGGVVNPQAVIPPRQIDGDGVAGDAGLGPGQQPFLPK